MKTLRHEKYNGKVILWGNVNCEDGAPVCGAIVILEGFCEIGGKYPKCKNCKYNNRSHFLKVSATNKRGKFLFKIANKKNISYRVRVFDD